MPSAQNKSWVKLDNAALVFPSTCEKSDTRVFRFACELFEDIDREVLQNAVDAAIEEFPHFLCVLRHGAFWYYLEQSDLRPIVFEEDKPSCSELYRSGRRNLLFEVSYFRKRINFEVFHALTDGTGALKFLKTVVWHYLAEKHADALGTEPTPLADISSASQKSNDSFSKYYKKAAKLDKEAKAAIKEAKKSAKKVKQIKRAYNLKGERRDDDNILIIDGFASVKKVVELAHKYNATVTSFTVALYIMAISKEMTVQSRSLPVIIGIPVNLRNYFPSDTARNFFYMNQVKYNFNERDGCFEDLISEVTRQLKDGLTTEKLSDGINAYGSIEYNPFVRVAPLFFKDFVIRTARHLQDKGGTSAVSNVGQVKMPEPFCEYIKSFSIFSSSISTQITMCSFGDNLQFGFSSAFVSTEVIKNFFRMLTDMGVEVTICCNDYNRIKEDSDAVL